MRPLLLPLARHLGLIPLLALATACGGADHGDARVDPHSYARPDEARVDHLKLDVGVDFETRRIEGRASLRIDNPGGASELWLDTRDLDIAAVRLDPGDREATFRLGDDEPHLGRPLVVTIEPDTEWAHVDYASRRSAAALQWLDPEQTIAGHPFLLSQSQAILARTWIPCQDSPAVRMTYEATVRVPPGLMAVMSAENPTETSPDGVYHFRMPQRIPAYLLALAVGRLEFREMGPRTGVYAEPEVVERAAWEFAETEKMMDATEALYGPYRWGRYDLIVLPGGFPFGGMENPRLTFLTPTLLAGDRSLVALVAHELAHSWSGNLVTNATWDDFWLNEGFTVYLERRIMEAVSGRDYSEMLALLGKQDLEEELDELGIESRDTHLVLDLVGRDPDEGMTDIAYEKGYLFLRWLEEQVGRDRWDAFLRGYFDRFEFQSVTTDEFLAYLDQELLAGEQLDLEAWIHAPGLPADAPVIESPAFARVETQMEAWLNGQPAVELDTGSWSSHEWLHFVRHLPDSVTLEQLAELDREFGFSETGNSEVLHAWLLQAIRHDYEPAYASLEAFLTSMGRRKFLVPLYTELARTPEGLERARRIYEQARSGYHPVSTASVDPIVGR